jgi:hypothetical protein
MASIYVTNIVWHRVIRPDGAFVREETPGWISEFGPMPEAMMLPLIAERKAMFQSCHDKQLERLRA